MMVSIVAYSLGGGGIFHLLPVLVMDLTKFSNCSISMSLTQNILTDELHFLHLSICRLLIG
jgi:hypothetical protein